MHQRTQNTFVLLMRTNGNKKKEMEKMKFKRKIICSIKCEWKRFVKKERKINVKNLQKKFQVDSTSMCLVHGLSLTHFILKFEYQMFSKKTWTILLIDNLFDNMFIKKTHIDVRKLTSKVQDSKKDTASRLRHLKTILGKWQQFRN